VFTEDSLINNCEQAILLNFGGIACNISISYDLEEKKKPNSQHVGQPTVVIFTKYIRDTKEGRKII
jgi:hypothetical protein